MLGWLSTGIGGGLGRRRSPSRPASPDGLVGLGDRLRWGRVVVAHSRFEILPVRLSLDDEIVGSVDESVDGRLREEDILEGSDPLVRVAVACDDRSRATGPLDEELIDVTTLVSAHGLESKVVQDEQVDGDELCHHALARVVEATLPKSAKYVVGAGEDHPIPMSTSEMTKRIGEKGLAHADGSKDERVAPLTQKAKASQLRQDSWLVLHLGVGIPSLECHVGVEPCSSGPSLGGSAVSSRHLILKKHEQEVFVRELLLPGEQEPIIEYIEELAELEMLERPLELRRHRRLHFRLHCSPPSGLCRVDRSWEAKSLPSWFELIGPSS